MKKTIYFAVSLVLFTCFSCTEERISSDDFNFGYNYFPTTVGKYITYKYDSVIYDDLGLTVIKKSGFLKEEIAEILSQEGGVTKYKIYKYWRQKATDKWVLTDVETLQKMQDKIIKSEENLLFVKMVFPNSVNTKWDGNSFFDDKIKTQVVGETMEIYSNWSYKITERDKPISLGSKPFPKSLEVIEVDDEKNIFRKRYSKAIYIDGVGLGYREMKIYDTSKPQAGKPWENYAERGYALIQELIDHN
jgi:hypothetical protein